MEVSSFQQHLQYQVVSFAFIRLSEGGVYLLVHIRLLSAIVCRKRIDIIIC